MKLKNYKNIRDSFKFDENELYVFPVNYYDAIAFNDYLKEDYQRMEFAKDNRLSALLEYMKKRNIGEEMIKKIVISFPQILSCRDFNKQLSFIYKDEKLEGIIIKDEDNNYHAYRMKNNLRSLSENNYLLSDMSNTKDKSYKKIYYSK